MLDALVQLFWERGFEGASLADIVEAAGLNKSSLYNTFGSKDELFALVLERYMAFRREMMAATITGDQGFDELATFFSMQREECAGTTGCMGCLAVNAQTELGLRDDEVARRAGSYRDILSGGLRPILESAAERGEIDGGLVDTYIDMLTAFTVSLSVAARSGAGTEELHRQIDSMERLADTWRH